MIHSCSASPPLPSGSSMLWSAPATYPSSDIADLDPELRHGRHRRHAVCGALELVDHDLPHLQHRGDRALRALRVGVGDQLVEDARHDLPRDAVAVLEPAARTLLPSIGERVPETVDLVLVLAVGLERDRLGEAELGPAVEREDAAAVELELDLHHHALGPWPGGAIVGDAHDSSSWGTPTCRTARPPRPPCRTTGTA